VVASAVAVGIVKSAEALQTWAEGADARRAERSARKHELALIAANGNADAARYGAQARLERAKGAAARGGRSGQSPTQQSPGGASGRGGRGGGDRSSTGRHGSGGGTGRTPTGNGHGGPAGRQRGDRQSPPGGAGGGGPRGGKDNQAGKNGPAPPRDPGKPDKGKGSGGGSGKDSPGVASSGSGRNGRNGASGGSQAGADRPWRNRQKNGKDGPAGKDGTSGKDSTGKGKGGSNSGDSGGSNGGTSNGPNGSTTTGRGGRGRRVWERLNLKKKRRKAKKSEGTEENTSPRSEDEQKPGSEDEQKPGGADSGPQGSTPTGGEKEPFEAFWEFLNGYTSPFDVEEDAAEGEAEQVDITLERIPQEKPAPPEQAPAGAVTTGRQALPRAPERPAGQRPGTTPHTPPREAPVTSTTTATGADAGASVPAAGMAAQHATEVTVEDVLDKLEKIVTRAFETGDDCEEIARQTRMLLAALHQLALDLAGPHNVRGRRTQGALAALTETVQLLLREAERMTRDARAAAEMAEAEEVSWGREHMPVVEATTDAGLVTPSARDHNYN
jgi:hypothetical protein